MKWIKDEDDNAINLEHMQALLIEDLGEDYNMPIKVLAYASSSKEEYRLKSFKTRKKAIEFIDSLIKDS